MTFSITIPANYRDRIEWDVDESWTRRPLSDVLAEVDPAPERFGRVRDSRQRAPLPRELRMAVLRRDGFTCRICGDRGRLEVDHIIPWSAGGPDASWNLRTLCHDCNQARSNYNTDWDARALPIVTDCDECRPRPDGYEGETMAWCDRCQWFTTARFAEIDRPWTPVDSVRQWGAA